METRLIVEIIHDNDLPALQRVLLLHPEQARSRDARGVSALSYAIERGRVECLRILWPFSDPTTLYLTPSSYGERVNALIMAVGLSQKYCMQELLPHFDPNECSPTGRTALMHACFANWEEGVRLLLPLSDANLKDRDKRNALMHAINSNAPGCVRLLAPHTDLSNSLVAGHLSLLASCMRRGHWECAEALLPFFSRAEAQNELKLSPGHGGARLRALLDRMAMEEHLNAPGATRILPAPLNAALNSSTADVPCASERPKSGRRL